jgi:hypothetical protein
VPTWSISPLDPFVRPRIVSTGGWDSSRAKRISIACCYTGGADNRRDRLGHAVPRLLDQVERLGRPPGNGTPSQDGRGQGAALRERRAGSAARCLPHFVRERGSPAQARRHARSDSFQRPRGERAGVGDERLFGRDSVEPMIQHGVDLLIEVVGAPVEVRVITPGDREPCSIADAGGRPQNRIGMGLDPAGNLGFDRGSDRSRPRCPVGRRGRSH